jgi:cytochrome c oxidase assembly factor CtaG
VVLGGAAALAPGAALAHGGAAGRPSASSLLTAWEFDPFFLFPVALAVWGYIAAVRHVDRAHPANPVPRQKVACFLSGMAALVLAIVSPIARYDTDLFSVHMVQHMLILFVAAPLMLAGSPITLALRAASPRVRKEVLLPVLHSRVARAVSWPVLTWLLLAAVMWVSHFSALFNGALENSWLHRFEHGLYLTAALLFWWTALGADPSPWRMNHPMRLLYVFLQMPQNSFLAVSIANATRVIFPHYASVTRTWGPSPLADQEWAGYIMWVVGDLGFLVVLAFLAYGWVKHEDRAAKRGDRARARERAAAAAAVDTA